MKRSAESGDLITAAEAGAILEVTPDRIDVMVEEGLLVPVDVSGERRFPRAEVTALRELGG